MPVRKLLAALLLALLLLFAASTANAYDRQLPNGSSTVTTNQGQALMIDRSTSLATVRLRRFARRGGSSWRLAIVRPRRGPVRSCLTMTADLRVRATLGSRVVGYRLDRARASDCGVTARVQGVARLEAQLRQVTPGRLRRNAERKLQQMFDSLHLEGGIIISDPPRPPAPVDDDPYQLLPPYYQDPAAPGGPTICRQDGKDAEDCDPYPKVSLSPPPSTISLEDPDNILFLETSNRDLPIVGIVFLVGKGQMELSSPLVQTGQPRLASIRQDGTPCPKDTLCWQVPIRVLAPGWFIVRGFVATNNPTDGYRYGLSKDRYTVEVCATSATCQTKK